MNFTTLKGKIANNSIIFIVATFALFVLCIGMYMILTKNSPNLIYSAEEQRKINSEHTSGQVDFIYTEREQKDIAKWKDKTMDDLVIDAMNGDKVALYNLGEYFFLGIDFPIDVRKANNFFAKSASLGFAPALENIYQMYTNDKANVFLGLVYKNLTISFGHTEFTRAYHDCRSELIKSSGENGQRIMNEIERIAAHKQATILKNQQYVQDKQKNKKASWLSLKDIIDEDYQYDHDYWLDVYTNNNENCNLDEIKEKDDVYLEKLHRIFYQAITSDDINFESEIQAVKQEMKNALYSTADIELLTRQAKSLAKKNYKFVRKIENDAKEAKNIRNV